MKRFTRSAFSYLGVVVLASVTLAGCGGEAKNSEKPGAEKTSTSQESEAPDAGKDPAAKASGQLTLDGKTWELTPSAEGEYVCLVNGNSSVPQSAIVANMLTPDDKTVGVHVLEYT